MGRPRPPDLVKLICGLLGGDADLLQRARQLLVRRLGATDFESELWPFTQTDYYRAEMGPDLKRQLLSFEKLIRPDQLAEIKLDTNRMETQIAEQCAGLDMARPVNIDPGYVDLGKLVLATTKDRAHRIYLQHGIHAEVTLQYAHEQWQPSPWTYPDYREPRYHAFLMQVRDRLHEYRRIVDLTNPPEDASAAAQATDDDQPIPFDLAEPDGPATP